MDYTGHGGAVAMTRPNCWSHLCRMTYAGGSRPSDIDIDDAITRCPYCGDLSPSRQREVDRQAVATLRGAVQAVEPAAEV